MGRVARAAAQGACQQALGISITGPEAREIAELAADWVMTQPTVATHIREGRVLQTVRNAAALDFGTRVSHRRRTCRPGNNRVATGRRLDRETGRNNQEHRHETSMGLRLQGELPGHHPIAACWRPEEEDENPGD